MTTIDDSPRTLVTGGTGFIGSHLVRALLDRGRKVRVLSRSGRLPDSLRSSGVELVRGDLRHAPTLRYCLRDVEVLYALGARNEVWSSRPKEFYEVNRDAISLLLGEIKRYGRGIRRLIYASSTAAIGSARDGVPADENSRFDLWPTRDHYAISKYLGELEVLRAAQGGLPVIVLNPTLVVGPKDRRPTPIGRFLIELASGRIPFTLSAAINLVDVRDVVNGFLRAEEHGTLGDRYVLGGTNLTATDLCQALRDVLAEDYGSRLRTIPVPYSAALFGAWIAERTAFLNRDRTPSFTRSNVRMSRFCLWYDSAKAKRELDWQPRPVRDTVRDAIAWFVEGGKIRGLEALGGSPVLSPQTATKRPMESQSI